MSGSKGNIGLLRLRNVKRSNIAAVQPGESTVRKVALYGENKGHGEWTPFPIAIRNLEGSIPALSNCALLYHHHGFARYQHCRLLDLHDGEPASNTLKPPCVGPDSSNRPSARLRTTASTGSPRRPRVPAFPPSSSDTEQPSPTARRTLTASGSHTVANTSGTFDDSRASKIVVESPGDPPPILSPASSNTNNPSRKRPAVSTAAATEELPPGRLLASPKQLERSVSQRPLPFRRRVPVNCYNSSAHVGSIDIGVTNHKVSTEDVVVLLLAGCDVENGFPRIDARLLLQHIDGQRQRDDGSPWADLAPSHLKHEAAEARGHAPRRPGGDWCDMSLRCRLHRQVGVRDWREDRAPRRPAHVDRPEPESPARRLHRPPPLTRWSRHRVAPLIRRPTGHVAEERRVARS